MITYHPAWNGTLNVDIEVLWIPRRSRKWKQGEADVNAERLIGRGNREVDVPVVGMDALERVGSRVNAPRKTRLWRSISRFANPIHPVGFSPLPVFPNLCSEPIASARVRAEITVQVGIIQDRHHFI
jgi:hypothetical protein